MHDEFLNERGDLLVVDDNADILRQLETFLRDKGFRVRAAPNGEFALHAAASRPPDLLLLDIMMPEIDGLEVCRRLKRDPATRDVPVIFLSAYTDMENKGRAFAAGGVDFIAKPFDFAEVLARVRTHLKIYVMQRALNQSKAELEQRVDYRTRELREINARLQTEIEERRQSEEKFAKVFEHAPIMVVLLTIDGWRMLEANATFVQKCGYSKAEMLNKRPDELELVASADLQRLSQQLAKAGYLKEREVDLRTRRGKARCCLLSAQAIQIGGQRCAIAMLEDISKRKKMEKKLKKAKEMAEIANHAKSSFLATMSHEIRTPMNAILGMLHLALRTRMTDKQRDYLDKARGAADSLLVIINDILDFSRIEAGKMRVETTEFMLDNVLEHVAMMNEQKAREKGLELCFSLAPEVARGYRGDPLRISQILNNLVCNAVKFTHAGKVTVAVAPCGEHEGDQALRFTVADTGIGMSEEQMHNLFQPFSQGDGSTTRRYGGTGLGLSISKRLVEMMGGELTVVSRAGKGSEFRFTLNLPRLADHEGGSTRGRGLKGLRVALAGDPNTQGELIAMLRRMGIAATVDPHSQAYDRLLMFEAAYLALDEPRRRAIADNRLILLGHGETLALADPPLSVFASIQLPLTPLRLEQALVKRHGGEARQEADKDARQVLSGFRVLLAEDNEINRQVASEILEDLDMEVVEAENGQQALELIQRAPGDFFDIVLMDIEMPVMDGREATARLRTHSMVRDLPIIAMTAHAMEGDRIRCLEAGMNDHIPKPIHPDKLYAKLCKWLPVAVNDASEQPPWQVVERHREQEEALFDAVAGLRNTNGNRRLHHDLVRRFSREYRGVAGDVHALVRDQAYQDARHLVHTVKGIAATLGGGKLRRVAAELESELELQDSGDFDALLAEFEECLGRTLERMEAFLDDDDGNGKGNLREARGANQVGNEIDEEVLGRLAELLEENDGDAFDLFMTIREGLRIAMEEERYHELSHAINNFRFDEASLLVKPLCQPQAAATRATVQ